MFDTGELPPLTVKIKFAEVIGVEAKRAGLALKVMLGPPGTDVVTGVTTEGPGRPEELEDKECCPDDENPLPQFWKATSRLRVNTASLA